MKTLRASSSLFVALFLLMTINPSNAAPPTGTTQPTETRPASLTASIGYVLVRIDGPKLWTLSRIEYKGTLLGVEDSAYGTVVTFPGAKHLGTAHFLDVPGHPGEVEKENVTELRFYLDDQPVTNLTDTMSISGKSFRVERTSKIRAFDLDSVLDVRDGVLMQSARLRAPVAVELQMSYPLMYAWTPTATEYLFGMDDGSRKSGKFLESSAKPTEGLEKTARWLAVYDGPSGKGAVTYLLSQPADAEAWFQYTDAPGIYRKLRLMSFVGKTIPAGFDGTFRMVTGFFSAAPEQWKAAAEQRAGELKAVNFKEQ